MSPRLPIVDLPPHDLTEVLHILEKHVPELEVWAFGSRVRWTAKEYSDLDLVLVTVDPLPIEKFSEIKEAFEESNLSVRVDLVDWAVTNESFRKIIEQDKLVIHKPCVKSGWATYKIVETGKIVTGKTPQTNNSDFVGTDVPFVTPQDFAGEKWIRKTARTISEKGAQSIKNCILPANSVLVSCIGSDMGKAALTSCRCVTNQQINAIIPDPQRFSPEFIYYNLVLRKNEIQQMAGGSAQPILNKSAFADVWIECPSFKEQKAIVEVLRPFDDRIALLRETNATLEAIAQALFKSWFVDFDPVHAKQQGIAPAGMDEATAALFPDSFEESALGLVPRGWAYVSLRDALSIFDSQRIPLSGQDRAQRHGAYPYYGAAALMDHIDGYLFDGIYLLLGEDGSVADPYGFPITQYVWGRFWVNNHAHVLQGKNGISTEHLMLAVKKTNIQPFITGAVQAKLSQSNMWRISFLHPGIDVATSFGQYIAPLFMRVRQNSEAVQTLATLRDTLLPRLISGQMRLPEAERFVAEAVA